LMIDYCRKNSISEEDKTELIFGLSAIANRFRSHVEAGESYLNLLSEYGPHPGQPNRYYQDRDFFNCVISGAATIESLFYSLYTMGAILFSENFPFKEENRKGIYLKTTIKKFNDLEVTSDLLISMNKIKNSGLFKIWTNLRKILFHRGLPGRMIIPGGITRSLSSGEAPSVPIDGKLINKYREWLSKSLDELLSKAIDIVKTRNQSNDND